MGDSLSPDTGNPRIEDLWHMSFPDIGVLIAELRRHSGTSYYRLRCTAAARLEELVAEVAALRAALATQPQPDMSNEPHEWEPPAPLECIICHLSMDDPIHNEESAAAGSATPEEDTI